MMDPIGFGFEKFDTIGQYQEKQNVLVMPSHGDRKPSLCSWSWTSIRALRSAVCQTLNFSIAKGTRPDPCGQPGLPGVHGEAAFPVRLRTA